MADISGTLSPISGQAKSHRQVIIPNGLSGSYVTQDTNNNDFRWAAMGKGRLSVAVNNAPNQAVTLALYGMHAVGGAVGDAGVFQIGSATTISLASKGYIVCNDPFPFYLIRLNHAVAPTDDPAKTVSVYVTPSAF
mgnify:FL=1